MSTALFLAGGGFLAAIVGWGDYLASIPRERVPARPVRGIVLALVSIGLAIAAIAWSLSEEGAPILAVGAPAAIALMLSSLFLFLLTQRRTPLGDIAVSVGDPLPTFSSVTSDGAEFDSRSLIGHRVLLKFFRGHW